MQKWISKQLISFTQHEWEETSLYQSLMNQNRYKRSEEGEGHRTQNNMRNTFTRSFDDGISCFIVHPH